MTTSKLPSLIGIRSILKGWFNKLITSSGWPLVLAVLGQMAHLVASITLNSTRSGSISLGSFLPSALLWLVIIVVVVGVGVTVVVVVTVGRMIHQDKAISNGVLVGPVFLLGLVVHAIVTACASRAALTLLATKDFPYLLDEELDIVDDVFCFLDVNVLLDNHDDLFRVTSIFCLPMYSNTVERKFRLDDSRFPLICSSWTFQIVLTESFLYLKVLSERVGEAIGTTPNEFEELEYVFPGEVGTYSGEAEIKSGKLEEKASSIPEIRWLGENIVLLTTQ
ncbi:hypothetical protein Tco_1021544 [Tanacetum coccineum]